MHSRALHIFCCSLYASTLMWEAFIKLVIAIRFFFHLARFTLTLPDGALPFLAHNPRASQLVSELCVRPTDPTADAALLPLVTLDDCNHPVRADHTPNAQQDSPREAAACTGRSRLRFRDAHKRSLQMVWRTAPVLQTALHCSGQLHTAVTALALLWTNSAPNKRFGTAETDPHCFCTATLLP